MTPLDRVANYALIGQWLGVLGMLIVLGLMLWRKARRASLTPPAAPEPDQRDWRSAPASKPR
jgi:hypothetical protein